MNKTIIAMALTLSIGLPLTTAQAEENQTQKIAASFDRAFTTNTLPTARTNPVATIDSRDPLVEAVNQSFWRQQTDQVVAAFQRGFANRPLLQTTPTDRAITTDPLRDAINTAFWRSPKQTVSIPTVRVILPVNNKG